jgi:antitoxin ParD1/3/4
VAADEQREQQRRLAALDASIALGITDAEAARVKPLDVLFDRLKAKYERLVHKT